MPSSNDTQTYEDEFWRDYLTRGDSKELRLRRLLRVLPHDPRCKLCAAPFGGPGGVVMRAVGKGRAAENPNLCNACFAFIEKHHGGAEINASFLFADVRGSTTLAERLSPADFHTLMQRFYAAAAKVVIEHDGGIDKFVGDEIVAFFFPLTSGPDHAAAAVRAGLAVLQATGHADPEGPWVPVGAGISSGTAWVGAVGDQQKTDLTALGDTVNIAARLGGLARAGEVLVTAEAAAAAGLDPDLVRRSVDLKGKSSSTEVVSLTVGAASATAV